MPVLLLPKPLQAAGSVVYLARSFRLFLLPFIPFHPCIRGCRDYLISDYTKTSGAYVFEFHAPALLTPPYVFTSMTLLA